MPAFFDVTNGVVDQIDDGLLEAIGVAQDVGGGALYA